MITEKGISIGKILAAIDKPCEQGQAQQRLSCRCRKIKNSRLIWGRLSRGSFARFSGNGRKLDEGRTSSTCNTSCFTRKVFTCMLTWSLVSCQTHLTSRREVHDGLCGWRSIHHIFCTSLNFVSEYLGKISSHSRTLSRHGQGDMIYAECPNETY